MHVERRILGSKGKWRDLRLLLPLRSEIWGYDRCMKILAQHWCQKKAKAFLIIRKQIENKPESITYATP